MTLVIGKFFSINTMVTAIRDVLLVCVVCMVVACTYELPKVSVADTKHSFGNEKADIELAKFIKSAQRGEEYNYLGTSLCGELCLVSGEEFIAEQLKRNSWLEIKPDYIKAYAYFTASGTGIDRIKTRNLEKYMTKEQLRYAKALADVWKVEKDEWDKKRKAGYETEEEKKTIYRFEEHPYRPFDSYLEDVKRGSSFTHAYLASVYCGEFCFTPSPNATTQMKQSIAHSFKEVKRHGIIPDYKLAYAHYILADNFKIGYADTRKEIATKLTEDEIKEAKALARKWKKESRKWNKLRGLKQPL